jgi:hypothetical protein
MTRRKRVRVADTCIVQILIKGAKTHDLWERGQRAVETARRLDPNKGNGQTQENMDCSEACNHRPGLACQKPGIGYR